MPVQYDTQLIQECHGADLSDADTERYMRLVVEPNLSTALRVLSACKGTVARREATRIRRALSAYRIRRDQRLAA